jgi:hypothetical protein
MHQLEEADAFKSDTDNRFIDGIDPHVMSMFDLHVPDSALTHHDVMSMFDLHVPDSALTHHDNLCDDEVQAISTASVGLLESNGACVTLFHEKRTNWPLPFLMISLR